MNSTAIRHRWAGRRDVRRNITVFSVYTLIILAVSGIDLLPGHILSHGSAFLIQYAVFCVLIVLWAISAQNRLTTPGIRMMHVWLVFFFILRLFFGRMHRLVFAGVYPWEHIFWYLCYIPNLALPLISFYMALYVAKDESFRLSVKAKLFVIPCVILVLAVLTNEYHEMAFILEDRGQAVSVAGRYHVSYVYYATQVWMFGFAALTILHLYRILNRHGLRAYVFPPVVLMGLSLLYTVLYAFDRSSTGVGYVEPSVMTVFSTMGLWEVCIIMRVIPSNSGYGSFFDACSVPMEILDRDGKTRYESEGLLREKAGEKDGIFAQKRTWLTREFEIPGGQIRWREDVTRFHELIARLEEGAQALKESNEKLDAQNRMRMREKKSAERARLYDEALLTTGNRIAEMRAILDDCKKDGPEDADADARLQSALARLCVLGAYVKRRSNLVILSDHAETLPLSELHFCLRESNEALVLVPVSTVYRNEADDALPVPAAEIMRLYDEFQRVIEERLPETDRLRMTLTSAEGAVTLTLVCGGAKGEETRTFSIPLRGHAA